MKIDLTILRSAIEKTLAHAEEVHGTSIEVDEAYYWFVPREQLYDPTSEPSGLTLGSLADDWAEMIAVSAGDKETFGYVLVWASTVLRAIGEHTP